MTKRNSLPLALSVAPLIIAGCSTAASDSSSPRSDAPEAPDATAEASATLYTGSLPACVYPAASLNPAHPPDGGVGTWAVARTFLACGTGCTGSDTEGCAICDSGGEANCGLLGSTSCLIGCEPSQYAVTWDESENGPSYTSSCTGVNPTVANIIANFDEHPRVICCPCE